MSKNIVSNQDGSAALWGTVVDEKVCGMLRHAIRRVLDKEIQDDTPAYMTKAEEDLRAIVSRAKAAGETVAELAPVLGKKEGEFGDVLIDIAAQNEAELQIHSQSHGDEWDKEMRQIGKGDPQKSREIVGKWEGYLRDIGALPVRGKAAPGVGGSEGISKQELRIRQQLNSLPPLDTKSCKWILASAIETEWPDMKGVGPKHLANLRISPDAARGEDVHGPKGIDPRGRKWRKENTPRTRVWYLRSTLGKTRSSS